LNQTYVHTYVCLLFVNGLIRVTPEAIRTYVHHDRKHVCIAKEWMVTLKQSYIIAHGHMVLASDKDSKADQAALLTQIMKKNPSKKMRLQIKSK
jgi:hypothetical protein